MRAIGMSYRDLAAPDIRALRQRTQQMTRGASPTGRNTPASRGWQDRQALTLDVAELRLALASNSIELNLGNVHRLIDSVEARLGYTASTTLPWRSRARLAVASHDAGRPRRKGR